MKVGDKVCLINREEVTGEIIDFRIQNIWGADYYEYRVQYDNPDLVPQQDWHDETHLRLIDALPEGIGSDCECGVLHVMPNGKHSDWCKLYKG